MPFSREEIQQNAIAFAQRWQDEKKWNEKSFGQNFVRDFLAVFGINAIDIGQYERRVGDGFADYLLPKAIAIEMKSHGKNLEAAYKQLLEYVLPLPADEMPELLMVSDFESIVLYHRTEITKKRYKPIAFKTKGLLDHVDHFHALAGLEKHYEFDEQFEVNVRAAEKMANLHDDLERHGYAGTDLEIYLVRLLFCLFAEDTGIFPKDSFLSYVANAREDGSDLSGRIVRLFDVLNMPDDIRAKRTLLSPELKEFRYVNGRLFEAPLPPADFDAKMRETLLDCCRFDWSKISPAIFGAMFQGVLDKNIRRALGAHYTSEENILKVVNPLFMDELWAKLKRVKADDRRLDNFHDEIAKLKFLDPACGCGNFLMIAYRELRKLEIEILRIKKHRQKVLDISVLLKVTIEQFYGIEIEDFPCEVARVSLWLMDHLMNLQVSKELGQYFVRLPLTKEGATIVHGNAHRINWEDVVPKNELSYIFGNPPYVGYSFQTPVQKTDVLSVYLDANGKPLKSAGKIDYVAAWYYKASKLLTGTRIRVAFVSTNSITQGEQVASVWKPLFEMFGIGIDFAYRTFKWSNEAKGKAAVHCVIIAFSVGNGGKKTIHEGGEKITVTNINPYLIDGETIFVGRRTKPLCNVPEMIAGGKPTDGGHLILSEEERDLLVRAEPNAQKYVRRYYMGEDFINDIKRYCLWLVNCPPHELRLMPSVIERIERVRQMRLSSKKPATQAKAETPMLFDEIRKIKGDSYIAIPKVSSERRKYIPIGFLPIDNIPGDKLFVISEMGLYGFGILTSKVHMAWMRVVCGRLKSDYSYSNTIVYNNFPWADATDEQKKNIETLAQAVLDARAKEPDSSLADLYDPLTMPPELLKAHQALDRAVMKLYKFKQNMSEHAVVAALMEMYQKLTAPPTFITETKPKKTRKASTNERTHHKR